MPKCVCGRGSAPYPAGEFTALPRPSSWIWGPLRGGDEKLREGKKMEGKGEGKGRGWKAPETAYSW